MIKIFELKNYVMKHPVQINVPELIYNSSGIISVDGPSGIGKSSFFRSLVGLEQATISELNLNGENVTSLWEKIRSQIFYLPQNSLNSPKVVLEYFIEIAKFNSNFNISHFDLLSALGLDLLDKKISSLSGGENQLLKLEIMLGFNPKIAILDEALTGVDASKLPIIKDFLKTWFKDKLVFNIHHAPTVIDEFITGHLKFSTKNNRVNLESSNS